MSSVSRSLGLLLPLCLFLSGCIIRGPEATPADATSSSQRGDVTGAQDAAGSADASSGGDDSTASTDIAKGDVVNPDSVNPDSSPADTQQSADASADVSDTALPDTDEPDTVEPDTVEPDTVEPDTVEPDTVEPDTVEPDTVQPDTVQPDAGVADSAQEDTAADSDAGAGSVQDTSASADAAADGASADAGPTLQTLIVLDKGKPGPTMTGGIGAFDSALNWATCENDGGAACPSISWGVVNDPQRGSVLQVKHGPTGASAGVFVTAKSAQDLSTYAGGQVLFDVKVVSGDPKLTLKIDCVYPCTSGEVSLGAKGVGGWESVSVPLNSLVQKGLKLSQVDTGLVIWASGAKDTVFQLDNARWEASGQPPKPTTKPKPLDGSKWFHQTLLPNGWGWFNGEVQHYTNRLVNSYVSDGTLKIVAQKEAFTDQGHTKQYTSARLNSKFAFKHGRVVVRAKLPEGSGTWPAIWMLGQNIKEKGTYWDGQGFGSVAWPACGEIDIMEHWGKNPNFVQSAMHTPSSYGGTINHGGQVLPTAMTQFHDYELVWSADKMVFSVDGKVHYTYAPPVKNAATWPFNGKQFLLLNIAIEPSIDPKFVKSAMEIDYVRVYAPGAGPKDKPIWADEFDQ